jgi:LysM repeat protein
VAMGDTISGILRKLNALGVTVDEIIKTNNLKNEKDIRPNDILLIPVNTGD